MFEEGFEVMIHHSGHFVHDDNEKLQFDGKTTQ